MENNLWIDNIIAISSIIEWQTPDGMNISVEDIKNRLNMIKIIYRLLLMADMKSRNYLIYWKKQSLI